MIVGYSFPGDVNDQLKWIQHDLYDVVLWQLFEAPRKRYLQALRLVGTTTELGDRVQSIKSFDHRVLQGKHDYIAAYFRFAHDDGGQMELIPNFPESLLAVDQNGFSQAKALGLRWQRFFEAEVERLIEYDQFVIAVLTAVAYQNTPQGYQAEDALEKFLLDRYGDLREQANDHIQRMIREEPAIYKATASTVRAAITNVTVASAEGVPTMPPLAVLPIDISEVAELGYRVTDMMEEAVGLPVYATGHCYAFYFEPLSAAASARGTSWHTALLQRAIAGLYAQKSQQHVLVGYQVYPQMIRVFVFARRPPSWQKFSKVIAGPGFMEEGDDSARLDTLRVLAYWEPPHSAVALWPTGAEGETFGTRVVDTGNLLAYFSEEVDEDLLPTLDPADYMPVPVEPTSTFVWNKKQISYANRFFALCV